MASIQEARTKLVISTTTQTVNQTLIADDTVNKVVSITAASLSIVGTMVIISTFVMWPDLRTTSRKIVVFISVGDFLVAASNITGELNKSLSVCRIQAAIGIFAVLPSFFWTVYLSFYFYLTICRKIAVESENRFMMFFHITAWGIPLIIAVLAVILKGAGHSGDFVSSGWCWISDHQSCWKVVLWMFVAGKGWELLAYISITAFYVLVKLHIRREVGLFESFMNRQCTNRVTVKRVWKGFPGIRDLIKIWCGIRENAKLSTGFGNWLLSGKRDSPKFSDGIRDFLPVYREFGKSFRPK